ncbi:MAG: hypothetical protein HKP61_05090 [Dactylosporangium sp.]|nr:hypothetical protein [Dactylosporangium sp.]NNJ60322.1 hypothetical protein [Dactylosporangium sp.]
MITIGTQNLVSSPVRIISIYATRWRLTDAGVGEGEADLDFGRLTEFYNRFRAQLPQRLCHERFGGTTTRFTGESPPGCPVFMVDSWLFALPSDQVVAALTLDVGCPSLGEDTTALAAVLEHCTYADIAIGDEPLDTYFARLAAEGGAVPVEDETTDLLQERHQIVFTAGTPGAPLPRTEALKHILYRKNPPYREEFTGAKCPSELNQAPRTLGAITPHVSLLYGHESFVQDSVFLSTVQAVGTASRFRQIWREAHCQVRYFRRYGQRDEMGKQVREDLEQLVDCLGNLEFDLTFSVEFPLMRIESFHSALYEAMDLREQAQTLSQMFTQLAGSIQSEITAIDIRERRDTEAKQKRSAFAVSALGFFGVPVMFVLGFLGINAYEVNGDRSMFDEHYLTAYIIAFVLALFPAAVVLPPYVRDWRTLSPARVAQRLWRCWLGRSR